MSETRNIFQNGPGADAMDLGFGPDPARPAQEDQGAQGQTVTLTKEQFDALLASVGQQRQEMDYAAALQGKPVEEPAGMPDIDLSALPDPRVDFDGFRTGLAQVLATGRDQILGAAQNVVQSTHEQNSTVDDAWALLQQRHPEIAQHADVIQMAAQAEINELSARGINPILALQHNMEAAVDHIAERATATINRIRGFSPDADSNDSGRTDVLTGGSPRPTQPSKGRQEQPTSFVDDLRKVQRELGIY